MAEQTVTNEWSWGQEETAFPTKEIQTWEWFLAHPSDERGQTDMLQARLDPEIGRRIDEVIQVGKEQGIPMKTRSDFLRFCVMRGLDDIRGHLDFQDQGELFDHWMMLEKQAARTSAESAMIARVSELTNQLVTGLEILTSSDMQEWAEAKKRTTEFLNLVMRMAGDQDFLVKTYIRGLFRNRLFAKSLDQMKEQVELGPVINNAIKAYERMSSAT